MHARQARKDGALRGRTVLAQTPSGVLCLSAYSCSTTLRTVFLLSPPNLGFGARSSVVEQICTRVLKFLVSQLEKNYVRCPPRAYDVSVGGRENSRHGPVVPMAAWLAYVAATRRRVRGTDGILEDSGGPAEEVRCLRPILNRQETKRRY
jgi:hypothetical protein